MASLTLPKRTKWTPEARWGLLFVALPLLQFLIFICGPMIFSLWAGLTDYTAIGDPTFIGLENVTEIFQDEKFWKALFNTFYMMLGIPIGMFLAMFLAMGMNRQMPGVQVFRVIYYVPVVSSIVAVAILWRWLYNGDYGLLNQILWTLFGIKGPNWMSNTETVKAGLIAMMVWRGVGGTTILYLAALQSIPKSYYEAALVDGSSSFHTFRKITFPLLSPINFFIIITSVIGGSQLFIEPSIMTDFGGPEYSAATIVYYLWNTGFTGDYGYALGRACAVAWILAIIVFVITLVQFRLAPKSDNYLE